MVASPVNAFVFAENATLFVIDGRVTGACRKAAVIAGADEAAEIGHRGFVSGDREATLEQHFARRLFVPLALCVVVGRTHDEFSVRHHHHFRRRCAIVELLGKHLARLERAVVASQVDAFAQRVDAGLLGGDLAGMGQRGVGLVQL